VEKEPSKHESNVWGREGTRASGGSNQYGHHNRDAAQPRQNARSSWERGGWTPFGARGPLDKQAKQDASLVRVRQRNREQRHGLHNHDTDDYGVWPAAARSKRSGHTFWSTGAVWTMLSLKAGTISVTRNTPAANVPSWAELEISWLLCLACSTHFLTTESIR